MSHSAKKLPLNFIRGAPCPSIRLIVILGFWAWVYGLRNNGDLWGKVFFLGFRLGILGILFYGDLRLGIFWLGFWAKE